MIKSESEIFESKVLINESHLDFMGHVNNAVYMTLFEVARWDFISHNGYGMDVILKRRKGPIILDCQIQFKAEVTNREHVVIKSHCHSLKGKIFKVSQSLYKADGREACSVVFTAAFFDMELRKIIEPTDEWLKACGLKP